MEYAIYTAHAIIDGSIAYVQPAIFDTIQSCISYVTQEHSHAKITYLDHEVATWTAEALSEVIQCNMSKLYTHN